MKTEEIKKPKGFGDTLANLTYIMGVDVTVKKAAKLFGVDECGCEKRQEQLNKLLPYKK